jgi:hypothetical protein
LTSEEYSELAALWNAPAAPAEERELEQIAERTPRRARLVQYGELLVGVAIGLAVLGAIAWRFGPVTLVIGSLILAVLGWSAWQRHRLANVAQLIDRSDRTAYLQSLVRSKGAELRRSTIGLTLIVPVTILSAALGYVLFEWQGVEASSVLANQLSGARGLVTISAWLAIVALLARSNVRLRSELRELRRLHAEYLAEQELDGTSETSGAPPIAS